MNNYTKLADGSWGAFINMDYDGQLKSLDAGTEVTIRTKAGETHTRIVKSTVKSYKSGCTVSLEPDHEIAKVAQARYQAKVEANPYKSSYINQAVLHSQDKPCPKCGTFCYGDCEAN